ncbi:MAG: cation transporter [Candidatus Kerfeldbacteria bacterium]|nr:cation transporter [Candidatus Kerfeldbacteria bacterium]
MDTHHHVPLKMILGCIGLQSAGFIVELYGSRTTGSVSLWGDAWHMLTDDIPLVLLLFSRGLIQRSVVTIESPTYRRGIDFGFLVVWLGLVLAGVMSLVRSIPTLGMTERHVASLSAIGWIVLGGLINWATHELMRPHGGCANPLHRGLHSDINTAKDHIWSDVIASGVTALCLVFSLVTGLAWWDTLGGLFVGGLMFWYAYQGMRRRFRLV